MTIGIDIDNTIVNTSDISNYCLKNNPKYNMVNNYKELEEQLRIEFLSEYLETTVLKPSIKEDVISVLRYFKNKGHKIVFITARGDEKTNNLENLRSVGLTSIYFSKNNLIYDEIIFFQSTKGSACLYEGIDVYIDDKEEVLDEVASKGTKTIRISKTQEKSKHYLVTNWLDIKKYIDTCGVK